jgi:hypothetical protein
MTGPVRKPRAPVEATQELQALDVVEIVDALKPRVPAAPATAPRKTVPSNSSIAPVGLDLVSSRSEADEEADATAGVRLRLPERRRRLGGIVVGAVAGCGLILLAAVIARAGHASSEPPRSTASTTANATTTSAANAASNSTAASTSTPASNPASTTPAIPAATPGDIPSTGTVRLERPAVAGRVWLDGKKLTTKSALVSCGTHQIKVGLKRTHSIDVPCGGDIAVSR